MNLFSLAAFTSFLVSVTVAADGLRRDHRTLKGYLFFSLAMCVALWAFAYTFFYAAGTSREAWFWYRLSAPGWSFLPAVSLHFILLLSGTTQFSRFRLFFIYTPAVIMTWRSLSGIVVAERFIVRLSPATLEIHATGSPWYRAYILYQISFLLVGTAVLLHWRRNTAILRYRKQANTVLFCLATALVLMNSMNFLPSLLGYQLPAAAATILMVVVVGAWYATNHYRMLELTPELAAGYMMSKMLDGVMLVDLAGKVRVVNDQCVKLLGIRRRELLGRNFDDFFTPGTLPDNADFSPTPLLAWNGLLTRNGQLELETSFGLRAGDRVPCFIALSSLLDSAGESAGTVAVIHDMRMEKELKIAKREAEAANRAKSLFLAHMGHDIKTPLNNIIGFAQILVSETDGRNRYNRLATSIMENGGYLLELLNDILDITQMESGQMKIEKAEFSLPNLLKEVAVGSRVAARRNGLDFFVKIQPAIPRFPVGDKKRIRQILHNLLSNSIKYTEDGKVELFAGFSLLQGLSYLHFTVSDTGFGVPAELEDQLFEPFVRGFTHTEQIEGRGLGLAICYELVKMMNGTIVYRRNRSRGAEFIVTIPVETPGRKKDDIWCDSMPIEQEEGKKLFHTGHIPQIDTLHELSNLIEQGDIKSFLVLLEKVNKSGFQEFSNYFRVLAEGFQINRIREEMRQVTEKGESC